MKVEKVAAAAVLIAAASNNVVRSNFVVGVSTDSTKLWVGC
jgi:hypothetical protein